MADCNTNVQMCSTGNNIQTKCIDPKGHMRWSYPVVHITIVEHGADVFYAFICFPVISIFQPLHYCAQIHWMFDEFIIILKNSQRFLVLNYKEVHKLVSVIQGQKSKVAKSMKIELNVKNMQFYHLQGCTAPLHQLAAEKARNTDASIKLWSTLSPDIAADWLHDQASGDV